MSRVYSWYVASMKPRSLLPKEPTLHTVVSSITQLTNVVQDLSGSVQDLKGSVQDLKGSVQGLKRSVQGLEKEMDMVKTGLGKFEKEMSSLKSEVGSLVDTVEFVKDTAVTRDEFKAGLKEVENKIIDHVDHFVKLHKKQEVEIAAVAHSVVRHEQTFHGNQAAA